MTKANKLDQFYTHPQVAATVAARLRKTLEVLDAHPTTLLEPSAGEGSLLEAGLKELPHLTPLAGDLDPKHQLVRKVDFLSADVFTLLGIPANPAEVVVLGNPPFGKKSALALAFLRRSLEVSQVCGFIVPVQFRKYLTQKTLPATYKLVVDDLLPENAFVAGGRPYHVNCCFQVWTTLPTLPQGVADLRQRKAPPLKHPAFDAWIYNATPQARKVFEQPWEIIVKRQGWEDFTPRLRTEVEEASINMRQQWMLLRGKTPEAHENLMALDYEALAALNTSVGGFGKADLVGEYTRLHGSGTPTTPPPPTILPDP